MNNIRVKDIARKLKEEKDLISIAECCVADGLQEHLRSQEEVEQYVKARLISDIFMLNEDKFLQFPLHEDSKEVPFKKVMSTKLVIIPPDDLANLIYRIINDLIEESRHDLKPENLTLRGGGKRSPEVSSSGSD